MKHHTHYWLVAVVGLFVCIPPASAQSVDDCGELIAGVECTLLRLDDGRVFIPSSTDGFDVGDRVRVTGTVESDCVSICQQGDGCLDVDSISVCTTRPIAGCGTMIDGVECLLIELDSGERVVPSVQGDFGVGARVYVAGELEENAITTCQEGDGYLDVTTLRACLPSDEAPDSLTCVVVPGAAMLGLMLVGRLLGQPAPRS